jgi:hypothetical protein
VKTAVDHWTKCALIANGRLFRSMRKSGTVWGNGITQNVIWYVVSTCGARAGITALARHDLRRTCREVVPCRRRRTGADSVPAGHAYVPTTKRYIGCKQDLACAVNDRLPFCGRTCLRPPASRRYYEAGISRQVFVKTAPLDAVCAV